MTIILVELPQFATIREEVNTIIPALDLKAGTRNKKNSTQGKRQSGFDCHSNLGTEDKID